MNNKSILIETTPLSERDCFMIFSRIKDEFLFPLHIHSEFELNYIENGTGAKRMVGDSMEEIDDFDLALITGNNLEHAWVNHKCVSKEIKEITIQFHSDLLNEGLLNKNQFRSILEMFERATYGVVFPRETIIEIKDRLYKLASENRGAHSVFKLFGILYDLSLSPMRELSSRSFNAHEQNYDSRRIEIAHNYLLKNYSQNIRLADVAELVGMTEVSFSRFIKKRTGRSFIDSLNDIRLGHASRMLVDTTHSIAEICMLCGFNNLSNFNRIFKKKKACTPRDFRENYKGSKFFL